MVIISRPPAPPGVDSMSNYEQVIRQVRYHNWRPAQTSDRKFRLTCSELNGRYTSNEFTLEVRRSSTLCLGKSYVLKDHRLSLPHGLFPESIQFKLLMVKNDLCCAHVVCTVRTEL